VRPIHIAHLDKARPVLVLTREVVIPQRTQITVAPVTSAARGLTVEVGVGQANGLGDDSVVNCDNIVTIPKAAFGERSGTFSLRRNTISLPPSTRPLIL
jgi:mRNA interferase MazF